MTDLVEKVARALCQGTPYDQQTALIQNVALAQARAAIAAVLDDLMASAPDHVDTAWIIAKRSELALSSPVAPGNAP